MGRASIAGIAVGDEVWIAAALLHLEQPAREDFTEAEILARVQREGLVRPLRPGVRVHINQHCVANRTPNPGRLRMLFETGPGRRRLFRRGDDYHPQREGARTHPDRVAVPERYRHLVDAYEQREGESRAARYDALLALRGLGREAWEGVDPDAYVRQLREGWQ
jgi:hypothetical protein